MAEAAGEYARDVVRSVGGNLKQILVDFLTAAVVWTLLYLFHFLPIFMPVPGWASRLIVGVHELGSLGVIVILVFYLLNGLIQHHRRGTM